MTKYVLRFDGLGSDGLGEILHAVNNLARAGIRIPEPFIEVDRSVLDLILEDAGANKIQVIKAIREITGLGLREAKDMADQVPTVVVRGASVADCDKFEAMLVAAGGTVRRSK